MSVRYAPVGWGRTKIFYDAVLLAAIVTYLLTYLWLGPSLQNVTRPIDDQTLAMRAWGSCAFLLLSCVLAVGPLCRLDRRFLPLLYNRRHFGVLTCAVAAGHASAVTGWYFAYSKVPWFEAVLGADIGFGSGAFPFVSFGIAGFAILCMLAFTSHDFWLSFLSPPVWKAVHMTVYLAYACIVAHVSLGALQDARDPMLALLVFGSVISLCTLHVAAAHGKAPAVPARLDGWIVAGSAADLEDGHGMVVNVPGAEAVAVFRNGDEFSAISNLCAHQNGPLGEGRVIDGCITCPWHGFQYRLADGCAPPPFTERLATYRLRLDGGTIWLDPRPNPPGTYVAPLRIEGAA